MYRFFFLIIIVSMITIGEIEAQSDDNHGAGSIGIGPQIGYQRAGDADAGRFMFGGFLRAKLSDAFAVEGSINYRTEKYSAAGYGVTVRSWPVLVSGLIYPFPMFYGLVGAGWYNTTFDFTPGLQQQDLVDVTKSRFGWHIGAGVEIPVAETVKLTGDIKYVFLDYKWSELSKVPLTNFNSNFYIISIGLAFGLK